MDARRFRIRAPFFPLIVLAMVVLAVAVPDFSLTWLAIGAAALVMLWIWGLTLAIGSGYRSLGRRMLFMIALFETFDAFGVALAWRALGEVPWVGALMAALFIAIIVASYAFRRHLIRVVTAEPFGLKSLSPAAAGTVGVSLMLLIRIAPFWFAQHILFPCMLILAAIPPAYWVIVERSRRGPIS